MKKRYSFGMCTSESFVIIKTENSDREISNSSPENNFQSEPNNENYLDISSEETDKWKNTLSGKKRSSLFADVKTLEQDGCCSVAYEYLCRMEEFRRYLSFMLNTDLDTLPANLAFEHQLSNGVWLCQLLEEVLPAKDIASKIFDVDHDTYKEEGLVYRHQQNICLFLDNIQELSFPDVLMPTTQEVFVDENRIKLIYTACALAYFLREIELTNHKIDNLEKYLKFDEPVLVEIMTMLESKALDLPSFECLQSLVDDELIYQRLKFDNTPLPSPSLSTSEKSYMTMKPSKHDNSSGDSGPEGHYSNKAMDKGRGSKGYTGTFGPDGEPIYEDADKYIKSEVQVSGDFLDSFDSPPDPLISSTFVSPDKDNNPRRRKLSKSRVHAVPAWGSSQLTMFPSRLEFNLFTCRDNSIRVCMYTKPKIDMIIPTSPSKGMPLNLKPLLEKLKQSVLSGNIEGMMDVLKCKHFQFSSVKDCNSSLYLQALKLELEDSLNKCALAVYYGMKKAQSEKYLAQSEQGSFLLRVGKKSPPSLTFSFRNKRGIKHFKVCQYLYINLSITV
ncbi:hypothetical protein LOD99_15720 [Oopsacas minuta]|uniref:SH2 domain-containing protein n=1 Tax=Oopsacas minuta TaxID=111878 RepID=A0AAV7KAX5_9METZ|nr:hypothetical protein LOD99_15720 [Oopsacas minuta]